MGSFEKNYGFFFIFKNLIYLHGPSSLEHDVGWDHVDDLSSSVEFSLEFVLPEILVLRSMSIFEGDVLAVRVAFGDRHIALKLLEYSIK